MSTFLWILFAALYLAALVSLGITTLRKGHIHAAHPARDGHRVTRPRQEDAQGAAWDS
jgi:hypothetical protein